MVAKTPPHRRHPDAKRLAAVGRLETTNKSAGSGRQGKAEMTRKRGFELVADDMADYVSRTGHDATYELPSGGGILYLALRAVNHDGQPHRRLIITSAWPTIPTNEDLGMLRRVFAIPLKIRAENILQTSHEATIHTVRFEWPHNPEVQP